MLLFLFFIIVLSLKIRLISEKLLQFGNNACLTFQLYTSYTSTYVMSDIKEYNKTPNRETVPHKKISSSFFLSY